MRDTARNCKARFWLRSFADSYPIARKRDKTRSSRREEALTSPCPPQTEYPAAFFTLDDREASDYARNMEKKVARVLRKIRHMRGLSEDEKYLLARSLAATPDERWRLHENFLRSHDLYTRSARRKYGFK